MVPGYLKLNLGQNSPKVYLMLGLQDFFLDAKGCIYVFTNQSWRVWTDIGWKAPPAIIPHFWGEGNLSKLGTLAIHGL
jgi:hypothetical protein